MVEYLCIVYIHTTVLIILAAVGGTISIVTLNIIWIFKITRGLILIFTKEQPSRKNYLLSDE